MVSQTLSIITTLAEAEAMEEVVVEETEVAEVVTAGVIAMTTTPKDNNAVDNDTAKKKKKKKKSLHKQPAEGKYIHDYEREMRNGIQKDDNNMCSFYDFGPHPAKRYCLSQ